MGLVCLSVSQCSFLGAALNACAACRSSRVQAIMDVVAAREVPVYFEVEEEIISAPTKASICTRCHYRLQVMLSDISTSISRRALTVAINTSTFSDVVWKPASRHCTFTSILLLVLRSRVLGTAQRTRRRCTRPPGFDGWLHEKMCSPSRCCI